jgi:CheY-like chemotaxis protein
MPASKPTLSAEDAAKAEASLKAREDFLKLMSHEIRTPLNGVLGMLGLLARTKLDGAQKAYLTNARDSAEHLLTLVNDILDFARIEAGKLELDRAPVDPELIVQGVCELLSPKAHEKAVELAWAVEPDLPSILSDDGRLKQILFNLAGNAVKFTESGGVLVRVVKGRRRARAGEARLRFEVADTGPGVPPEARAKIFEEFGHADPSHATRYGGAGLGLAVVKRLVNAFGGQVGLDSTPGVGSTFWFEAGFALGEPKPTADPPLFGVAVSVAAGPVIAEAAAALVEACGGHAIVAPAPEEAAGAEPGAVMLIDHALAEPGRLVARPQGRKALILLRPEERELIEKYRGLDYAGYLIKPLRKTSVAARIKAVLAGRSGEVASPSEDERMAPAAAQGSRVLLVEDNPVGALLAQSLLKREGCTVERAASGEEALAALARSAFDMVLMDVNMPGMDGLTATRAMRERGDRTPVVALTANAYEEDRKICLEAGMNDFLPKPFEPCALRAALARWARGDVRMRMAS